LRQMLQAGCIFDELLPFKLRFEPWYAGKAVRIGTATVTPFPTTHLADFERSFGKQYPNHFGVFSFVLEQGALRIGHTADIGSATDLQPLVERPLAVLVCELAHVDPAEIFQLLASKPIDKIIFIHLSRELEAQRQQIEARARKILGADRVLFARDGDKFTLS